MSFLVSLAPPGRSVGGFGIDGETIAILLGLVVLTLLLTGPAMWSTSWGWGPLDKLFKNKDRGPGKRKP